MTRVELLSRETPNFIRPELWPANSLALLNPVDYRIWGPIQESVCKAEMQNINDIKQHLISVWAELASDQWQTKHRACIRAKVQHFEHLLNWLVFGQNCGLMK